MFSKSSKSRMPNAGDALPGRTQPLDVPATHYVTGGPLAPTDASLAQAMFGMGCFWGAEKMFWQTPGVVSTQRRLRRRVHAQSHVRRGLQRRHRTHRSGARLLRSRDA